MRLALGLAGKTPEELGDICAFECKARCCRQGSTICLTATEVATLDALANERGVGVALRQDGAGAYLVTGEQQGGRCPFLDDEQSQCGIYEQRPNACRNFPEAPMLDGCLLAGWQSTKTAKIVMASVHGKDVPYQHLHFRDLVSQDLMLAGMWGGKVTSSSVRVDQNRNDCVEAFLETDADALLFIDDDQAYPPGMVKRLWEIGAPIAGGVYFQRSEQDPYPHVYRYEGHGKGRYGQPGHLFTEMRQQVYEALKGLPLTDKPVVNADPGPLLEVDAVATGCVLIRREVFESMPAPWFQTEGATNGDMQFFYKAKQLHGFRVVTDLGIIASHYSWRPIGAGAFIRAMRAAGVTNEADAPAINSREYWDRLHREEYGQLRGYPALNTLVTTLAAQVIGVSQGVIGDFGCGRTTLHAALHEAVNCHIVGIDHSSVAQEDNRRRFPKDEWITGDVTTAVLEAESLDIAFSNSCIEHLSDPKRLLDQMWRAIKPGGYMVMGIPLNMPHAEHTMVYDWDGIMAMLQDYTFPLYCYPLKGRAIVAVEKLAASPDRAREEALCGASTDRG